MIMHDSIEEMARKLYVKSGNVEGHDIDNWIEAERIVWNDIEEEVQCVLVLQT